MEYERDGDASCIWSTLNVSQELGKKTGGYGKQRENRDDVDHITIKIGYYIQKSS